MSSTRIWVEVVEIAWYLVKQCPSLYLVDKIPLEVWFGKKPSLAQLRVFGCDSFVHVPKKKRNKLDNKEDICIFIGYKDVKGYKLYTLVIRKIVYSGDVIFIYVECTSRNEDGPREEN